MKRYDLSKIMKAAHKLVRTGKYTMSEALKKSWKMEKFNVWMKEQSAIIDEENRIKAEKEAQRIAKAKEAAIKFANEMAARRAKQAAEEAAQIAKEEKEAEKMGMTYNEYQNFLSRSMGYGLGRYCGD